FEIIFISKAWELNENKEIVNDIYDQVATQDQIYATVPQDHYIRATFDQILDNTKDITIYAKLAAPSSDGATAVAVEVYPVYTDADGNQTQGAKLNLVNDGQNPDFSNISADGKYRILLQNLQTPTDVFDLRVVGGTSDVPPTGIDFDYIVDPSVGSSFSNETKIGAGTTGVALNGGVTIAPCYAPNPSWTLVGTSPSTVVRDLSVTANSTTYINKDIYCDSINCILWTAGATAPGTVCISTDANVYSNLLWSKTDTSATKAWANTANSTVSIAGGDIGGTHATNKVGSGSTSIGTYKWLERYYTSTNGTAPYYPAMDACKLKGLGWRLPTILELDSIRDQTASGGIYSRLPGMTANDYWSSSGYSATSPFGLYFYSGNVDAYSAKSTANYVRCVRGY
ncbi:MAG: DUF1566 domain-containing protein, partial [Candidatus Staskawiczbacteria bacterium]|nr:DUF1566 domain-containing protein [Candidatus Staskawiczbacteria bacterium]